MRTAGATPPASPARCRSNDGSPCGKRPLIIALTADIPVPLTPRRLPERGEAAGLRHVYGQSACTFCTCGEFTDPEPAHDDDPTNPARAVASVNKRPDAPDCTA